MEVGGVKGIFIPRLKSKHDGVCQKNSKSLKRLEITSKRRFINGLLFIVQG